MEKVIRHRIFHMNTLGYDSGAFWTLMGVQRGMKIFCICRIQNMLLFLL